MGQDEAVEAAVRYRLPVRTHEPGRAPVPGTGEHKSCTLRLTRIEPETLLPKCPAIVAGTVLYFVQYGVCGQWPLQSFTQCAARLPQLFLSTAVVHGFALARGTLGNWACTKCPNINFPTRIRCNFCHTPRPITNFVGGVHEEGDAGCKQVIPAWPQ